MTQNIDDFFNDAESGGGGGIPGAAAFDFDGQSPKGIGLKVAGEIVDVFINQQTEADPPHAKRFDKNNKPMMQSIVTLQTQLRNWEGAKKPWTDKDGVAVEDTGLRKIYIKFQGARATAEAIREAGAVNTDFVGGVGAMFAYERIAPDPGFPKMNQFSAKFKKGDKAPEVDDFLSSASPEPASAPAAAPAADPFATSGAQNDEPPF